MANVAVVKEEELYQSVRKAIELCNGITWKRGDSVLIKPNIASGVNPYENPSAVTRPDITISVARFVRETGGNPIIAESGVQISARGGNMEPVFRSNGIWELANQNKIPLVDLTQDKQIELDIPNAYILKKAVIAKTALEVEKRISLPSLKHHFQAVVSLGLKNMKGCLRDDCKKKCHRVGLEKAIVDFNRILKPDLVLIDAWKTWDRIIDKTYNVELLIAGTDPVAVDNVGCQVMGFEPNKISMLIYADSAGLGCNDSNSINILGEDIREYQVSLTRPPGEYVAYGDKKVFIREKNSCSGCWSNLRSAGSDIFKQYGDRLKEFTVVMGEADLPSDTSNTVAFGTCCKKFSGSIPIADGCPPTYESIMEAIKQLISLDK